MATFAKVNDWLENLHNAGIDLDTDVLQFKLTNTAPASETPTPLTDGNGIAANATDITYTNYEDDMGTDRVLEGVTSAQTSGTFKLDANDIVITAGSGGAIPTFRYVYLFDQTIGTPVDPLMGSWDHGAAIDLAAGESATITWNAGGIYTNV